MPVQNKNGTSQLDELQEALPPLALEFRIRVYAQQVLRCYGEKLAPFGVTAFQFWVLACLWQDDGMRTAELSDRLSAVGATTTGILQGMERAGLIERQHDPSDRRVIRLWLTDKGKRLKNKILPAVADLHEELVGALNRSERETTGKLIAKLMRRAEKIESE